MLHITEIHTQVLELKANNSLDSLPGALNAQQVWDTFLLDNETKYTILYSSLSG